MYLLNIGVIGVGFIGAMHIDAIRRIPWANIMAISESNQNLSQEVKDKFCIELVYTDWHEMITNPQINVIHNCTPNHLHDEINRAAIEAGKHIYSEKPLSLKADTAKELWKLAIKHKVAHAVNHQYRLNAAVQEMKDRIQNGECGRPLFVRGYYLQESHSRKTDYSKRLIPETSLTRAISDLGSHWADTVKCVMNQPIVSVMADMQTHHPVRIDPVTGDEIAIHSDDTTSVLFQMADGTPGMMMASKAACGHKNDLLVTVEGEECEFSWHQQQPDRLCINRREQGNCEVFMNSKLATASADPYITLPPGHVMGWSDVLRNNILAFYTSIWSGSYLISEQIYATFEDGWYTNLFIDACIKSSQDKRWVNIIN